MLLVQLVRRIQRLRAATQPLGKVMKLPDVVAQYATVGFDVYTSRPAELQAQIKMNLDFGGR